MKHPHNLKERRQLIEQISIPFIISILVIALVAISILMRIPKTKYITVGYPLIEGFQELDEQGNPYGYQYEIIKQIANYNHWNISLITGDYQDLIAKVGTGEIDLMGGVQRTPETQRNLSFTNIAGGNARNVLLSRTMHTVLYQYKALHQKKIGFLANQITYSEFELLAQNHNFMYEPFFYDSYGELINALESDAVDVVSISSMYRIPSRLIISNYSIAEYYFVTAKERPDLLAELNDGLASINRSQPQLQDKLYQHYYIEEQNTLFQQDSHVPQFLLFLIYLLLPAVLFYFIYQIYYQHKHTEPMHQAYVKGIQNNEMKVRFIPIASAADKEVSLFALQYYWDSPLLGQLSKDDMMKIRGKRPRLKFRYHELTVICRSIAKVINNPQYQQAQFIIAMSNPYPNRWAVYRFMFLLQYFLRRYQVPAHHLLFSFTNEIVREAETKLQMARIGHKFGFRFVMSDFAFQFSSLSQLKKINYDYFTIDALYTTDASTNEISYQIMKLIVNIAASLQKQTIAFGIDTEEAYHLALEIGCDYVQGAFISQHLELEDLQMANYQ